MKPLSPSPNPPVPAHPPTMRMPVDIPAVWSGADILKYSHDAIIGRTIEGRIASWNPAAEKLFGYRATELVGKPFSHLVPLDRRAEESRHADCVHNGDTIINHETIYRHQTGRLVPVSATLFPLRDFAGEVAGIALCARDLTREKLGDARAIEAEQRHDVIFQNNPLPMWVHDVETLRFLTVNDAALRAYGYSRAEFLQLTVIDLVPANIDTTTQAQIDEIASLLPGLATHRRQDGTLLHLEITAREVTLAGRAGRLVTVHDVTSRLHAECATRRLNSELDLALRERTAHFERAVSELEAFSYSVSHDLRAPLRCIHGFARTLAEEHAAQLEGEGLRLLGVIRQEAQHMGQLIDDILAFSRVGRRTLDPSEINMTHLAEGTFQELLETTASRPIPLQVTPLPSARGDRVMIRLALTNLLSNALKFTSRQAAPEIAISGRCEGGQSVYCVRDNGVGFDPRYAHKLFNVFQRLHSQDEFEGTGVGLAIVQRIIHRHGGKVWAEGEIDRGAAFYFSLPSASSAP